MKLPLPLVVLIAYTILLQQAIVVDTAQISIASNGVTDSGVSKRSAKDHTLYFPSMNDESKSTCPIYQRKLLQLKYDYYSILFKIKYFFMRLFDCIKDYFYSTNFDKIPTSKRITWDDDTIQIWTRKGERIKEIVKKLPTEERVSANEAHRKWVSDCHSFGQQIIYSLKKQAEERDELMSIWSNAHNKHVTYLHTHLKEDKYLESDDAKMRLLFIHQDWTLMKYRMTRLYKQQYKHITSLQLDNKQDRPIKLTPLYDILDTYQYHTLSITHWLYKNFYQTQSELEWQVYQTYSALKELRYVAIVRESSVLATEKREGMVIIRNRQYQSLIPMILLVWDEIPENTLPYSFFYKASYWHILLYCLRQLWNWIVDVLRQCLHKSNQAQKKKLHDVIDYL